jgi:hypothetical protein
MTRRRRVEEQVRRSRRDGRRRSRKFEGLKKRRRKIRRKGRQIKCIK